MEDSGRKIEKIRSGGKKGKGESYNEHKEEVDKGIEEESEMAKIEANDIGRDRGGEES